jgi:DNA-binding NarL/FixJ family response regulator
LLPQEGFSIGSPLVRSPADTISLLLVDEHQMFTDALSRLLATETDLLPQAAVTSISEAVVECSTRPPDVVLVDLRVHDMDGVAGIREIRRASPHSAVIVVTDFGDTQAITSAVQAGARGYVVKTRPVDELVAVIRQAAVGEMGLTAADVPTVIGRLQVARQHEIEARRTFERLTAREGQILVLLAYGRSTSETAAELHISPLTVRSHVKSILAKLGVHSKLEAVSYALRNGLVESDRSA